MRNIKNNKIIYKVYNNKFDKIRKYIRDSIDIHFINAKHKSFKSCLLKVSKFILVETLL